jgi:ADP-heptose:LPS heptosyltransferase
MMNSSYPPLPEVRSILVLRPNAIGDFMFALPALHALRHTYPQARILLLGKQWHADFLHNRPGPVDEVIVMPPVPGVGAPPDAEVEPEPGRRFIAAMREARFDLGLQMYGGGRYSNPFIMSLGARLTVGPKTPEATPLDRWIPYGAKVNRRLELLEVAALAGAERRLLMQEEITATAQDRFDAVTLIPPRPGERLVILHPGASDVRRRWPPERFAAVADILASRGATIVISATESEGHLARAIVTHMRHPALDLTGRMPLTALSGLLERAELLVSNDTGPLHLALALGTPSVGIFWLTNLLESGPLRQHLLRPALSLRVICPVCGADNRSLRCEHDVCFVDDVTVEEVSAMALELFGQASSAKEPASAEPAQAPHASYRRPDPRCSDAAAGLAAPSA